ncbi:hypothetical protein ACFL3E_01730 [Patescibacteria group bacterium]
MNKGIAALLTIIIVGAATLIMAYNASILGIGELDLGWTSQKGGEALSIADGCMEEAYRRIRLNTNYSGEYITSSNGSCIINIMIQDGTRKITVTASTTNGYYKKLESQISLSGNVISITSWAEKSN